MPSILIAVICWRCLEIGQILFVKNMSLRLEFKVRRETKTVITTVEHINFGEYEITMYCFRRL